MAVKKGDAQVHISFFYSRMDLTGDGGARGIEISD
jgi:hypothetical protein